jgi:hypothetical protein
VPTWKIDSHKMITRNSMVTTGRQNLSIVLNSGGGLNFAVLIFINFFNLNC